MNKEFLCDLVSKFEPEMRAAEKQIWTHPESGFREWETSKYLAKIFEDAGYTLTYAGDIPGFYTDLDTGRPGPKLLILCELDALVAPNHFEAWNDRAHACGHHAQCAAMVGIALALKQPGALDGLSGSIRLMAVPAEELIEVEFRDSLRKQGIIHYLGGKVEYMYRGYMDGCDLAYMFHTGTKIGFQFDVNPGCNGCIAKTVSYAGVAAHAGGSPDKGVNALYAASLGLQAVNSLRETFVDDEHVRVHPIMTEGGASVNIIPSRACLSSYIRGASFESIETTNTKVNRALAAGALAMGAKAFLSDRPGYAPLINSPELMDVATEVMSDLLGAENVDRNDKWGCGSTDMGDLSCVMPVLHPHISGAAGQAHGDDYHIADFKNAVVRSAQGQVMLAHYLLENDAARAKHTVEAFKPRFASMADYFKKVDRFMTDHELVEYTGDGANVQY